MAPRPHHLSSRSLSPAPALDSAAPGDLTDALCEFDAVLADFASPFHERHFHYEEHLERMKRRSSTSVSDSSGFSDSESKCGPTREGARGPGDPRTRPLRSPLGWGLICESVNRGVGALSLSRAGGPAGTRRDLGGMGTIMRRLLRAAGLPAACRC